MQTLADYIKVRGRFHRSVHLERDASSGSVRSGYMPSPRARELATRLLSELLDSRGTRAWSIIGPYGTGKSAFALWLMGILANSVKSMKEAPKQPFFLVPVVGSRKPLGSALRDALAQSLEQQMSKESRALARKVREGSLSITESFQTALDHSRKSGKAGLALIVDEFGKFLEYAAFHPSEEDLYSMQELAELASRTKSPFLLMTISHTQMDAYLPRGEQARLAEWRKLAGRFTDVPFLEPDTQMIRLIGNALDIDKVPESSRKMAAQRVKRVLSSGILEQKNGALKDIEVLLQGTIPLDPVTALILPGLFRSEMAQNERSVFAFLTMPEPGGFAEFLQQTSFSTDNKSIPLYSLSQLYDYVRENLGLALYRGTTSRRWAEIDNALDRLPPEAPELAADVVKAIGLIRLHGYSAGLKASPSVIAATLDNSNKEVDHALEFLQKTSLIVYRRHEKAFAIWEGSDVDLEALYERERTRLEGVDFFYLLNETLQLRPIIARKHYYETGSIRAFGVRVVNELPQSDSILQDIARIHDGEIIYLLSATATQIRPMRNEAKTFSKQVATMQESGPVVIAVPKPIAGLAEAVVEVEVWRKIAEEAPELTSDSVAREEVRSRLVFARQKLEQVAGETFGMHGQPFQPRNCYWYYEGEELNFGNAREFQNQLSSICDKVYINCPPILNELINRSILSSAASRARSTLLRAMINEPDKEHLAIQGAPPELSMYLSVLQEGGWHKQPDGDTWRFIPPTKKEWKKLWSAIKDFYKSTNKERRPLTELYDLLSKPPFGLKAGVLPVLFLASYKAYGEQVALYDEDGMYIPELREETVELLQRNPSLYRLQEFKLDSVVKETLELLEHGVKQGGLAVSDDSNKLLALVKPLVIFAAKLPDYTKNTRTLDSKSLRLRDALLKARDPGDLLVNDIPKALEHPNGKKLASELKRALIELGGAYQSLLKEIGKVLISSLALPGEESEAYIELRRRAENIAPYAADPSLALFLQEILRNDNHDWRETLGRVVQNGKPTNRWMDRDFIEFKMRMARLRGDFQRTEEVASEEGTSSDPIVRVGVLRGKFSETRQVIRVGKADEQAVEELADRIRNALQNGSGVPKSELVLAALARALEAEIHRNAEEAKK